MRLALPIFAAALAGCSMTIDESTVFQPKAQVSPAATEAELARWPEAEVRAAFPDVTLRHGFLGEGEARVAYTLAARPGETRALVVHCGGNAADRYNSGPGYAAKALPHADILLFDYPGYGDSAGTPTAAALDAAARAVAAEAQAIAGARPLVFWGHSLGGFVCSEIAGATPAADAVILEATARNASDVAAAWTPWYAGPFVRISVAEGLAGFDSAEALSGFKGPVLVLGAGKDDTLPPKLARALAEALKAQGTDVSYVELADAGHGNVGRQPEFAALAAAFFARLAAAPSPAL